MERRTDSGALDALAREYWDTYLEASPLFATAVGDPRFDDCLPDPTPEGVAACRVRFEDLLARVDALDASTLTGAERTTHSALRESLAADIAERSTGLLDWNVDPIDGVPADFLAVPDYQPLETPGDAGRMVARWREMARYTDLHLATLRRSLAEGRVAARAPILRAVAILEDVLDAPTERWPLLDPIATLDGLAWSASERDRFARQLHDVVELEIRPAFIRLHDALVTEVIPASRGEDRPGMCEVPGGPEGYRHLIRMHTSLDIDAATLHRTGLAEIERIDAELGELGGQVLGLTGHREALLALQGDPRLYFQTREEVYSKAAACLERAAEAAPRWFGRLPLAACEITQMGAHEEDHVGAAYYRQGAADGSRPGQYVINTSRPETRPHYEAEAMTYHESIPGHHLQVALGQELGELPAFRRHLGPTAYFEGWGLYAERLADEMGLYSSEIDRLGLLSFDAWRAARLVVDTGLHALGWSRQQAIDFLVAHTALSAPSAVDEVDRYIVLPGQALAYKTGQLELLRLRAQARAAMGHEFDIREFHDVVLGGGALPLPTLDAVVSEWAARRPAPA
jgi:uncharacterized protein (DUF885 family)